MQLKTYFPILGWGRRYNRQTLTSDLIAAIIVTIMLIPQSLAYALLDRDGAKENPASADLACSSWP